ncbi:MAG: FHA domain-containing protein [Acidimicrobiia bacterium]|nr:FHA domain-containing protein [Acidimicrobiia bacterium]MCY4456741.1 FHA domain-containing protein [Acidimicrobiaceae bacterium]
MTDQTCAKCGHRNTTDARFCSSCGDALSQNETTTTHDLIDLDNIAAHFDRSAFGVHDGLLFVLRGQKAGARYALDADLVTLGRHPQSDIFLDDISVSRHHAEVCREGFRYLVRDAGSLNGTYVERQRVDEHELHDGEVLQIGRYKMVFVHGTQTS